MRIEMVREQRRIQANAVLRLLIGVGQIAFGVATLVALGMGTPWLIVGLLAAVTFALIGVSLLRWRGV